jgi:hypothetical protein
MEDTALPSTKLIITNLENGNADISAGNARNGLEKLIYLNSFWQY